MNALLVALLLMTVGGCTFERRSGVEEDSNSQDESAAEDGAANATFLGPAAALETVELFRASVANGDLSLALSLVDREAVLVDALVGTAAEAATRGELLLELRRRYAEGMRVEEAESGVTLLAEGVALVLSVLVLMELRDDGIGDEAGRVRETVVLVTSPEGWRIRHLHRSFAPGAASSPSPVTNE